MTDLEMQRMEEYNCFPAGSKKKKERKENFIQIKLYQQK